jgi:hypothetical protein
MRRLLGWLDNLWYHRPVITTHANLDAIDIAARISGMRYEQEQQVAALTVAIARKVANGSIPARELRAAQRSTRHLAVLR